MTYDLALEQLKVYQDWGLDVSLKLRDDGPRIKFESASFVDHLQVLLDNFLSIHGAAILFLAEYEAYKLDPNSVIFTPKAEVLEAFRKAVKG